MLSPETLARIDSLYDAVLAPKLAAIDAPRRQVLGLAVRSAMVLLPPIVFLIARGLLAEALPFTSSTLATVLAWLWLVGGLIFVLVTHLLPGITAYANYRSRFKQEVVPEIFRIVSPTATYEPLQGITAEVFDAAGLFNTRGGFQSDDRVRGRLGRIAYEASEVGRSYSTTSGTTTTGNRTSHSHQVFRGLFFHLDSGRRLNGVVLIDPARARHDQLGPRDGLQPVTLDDPAFAKEFTVHASNQSEARALLTPGIRQRLLTLRGQAGKPVFLAFKEQRAYVAVDYGRTLFEPGVALSTSKEAVREIAGHFAFVEAIVRELGLSATSIDDSLLRGAGIEANPLAQLAAVKRGTMTASDVWDMAAASIDDAAGDGEELVPMPADTRIRLEHHADNLSISYGLRFGFWVLVAISLIGALVAVSALRAPAAPAWAATASAWVRTLPPVPRLDEIVAGAPTVWLIAGVVVAVLFGLWWSTYVRSVSVDSDRIRIYRGFRPFPRVYRRPPYGRAIRINTAVYIAKSDGVHMSNPTASPVLTEAEAKWLTSELKRALRTGRR